MSYPHSSRNSGPANPFIRVNGKIRAREVRVVGEDGKQLGILPLADAINLARSRGVDLVEIAANATPPVCRIVDFGKYRYELAKKDKESKKHQHANRVKEIQLSPGIDPHDFSVKFMRAVDFLCDEMKVKVALKFRGREMAHQEFGFQQVNKFIADLNPWGHADFAPKLAGRSIHVMISPLPRAKRAKNPKGEDRVRTPEEDEEDSPQIEQPNRASNAPQVKSEPSVGEGFANNPFGNLDSPQ